MPEANDQSTNPAASGSTPPPREQAIDDAMEAALADPSQRYATSELPLKKQWDDELDAELEAAMSGFDPKTFDVAKPREKRPERAPVAKGDRGQERSQGQGPRMGRVISQRGKSLFIDLGGKSEGVIPLDLFEGEIPAPGTDIEVVVDHFDRSEGIVHLRLKGSAIEANWDNLKQGRDRRGQGHKDHQGGRRGRRRRHPRVHAHQPDRPQPRRGRRGVRQPEAPRDRHRGQRPREEPGRLPPRTARTRTRRDAREDLGDA